MMRTFPILRLRRIALLFPRTRALPPDMDRDPCRFLTPCLYSSCCRSCALREKKKVGHNLQMPHSQILMVLPSRFMYFTKCNLLLGSSRSTLAYRFVFSLLIRSFTAFSESATI
ncbi:hypothetical protein E2C01_004666 [Portunus trituberculatus]|uniref:Secreted protein n=1 Tax=Portunus trituberculatus TaxID=210409 RepID=A0A5B7CRB6_PORTR|nr:hypothetical protein [Portunus trituberculatus]